MKIIGAFQRGSPMFKKVQGIKNLIDSTFNSTDLIKQEYITKFEFNDYNGQLVHTSLLVIECLAVVILNLFMWPSSVDDDNDPELEDSSEDGSDLDVQSSAMLDRFSG